MRFLLMAIAVLIALIVIVALLGYALPKGHRASRKAIFHRRPDDIYALIAESRDWEPKGSEGIKYEIVETQPPRRLVRRIASRGLPFGGSWTFDLSSSDAGTVVRITEDGEIYNPVFRFVSRFFLGYTRTIDDYLNALGKKLGEQARPND